MTMVTEVLLNARVQEELKHQFHPSRLTSPVRFAAEALRQQGNRRYPTEAHASLLHVTNLRE